MHPKTTGPKNYSSVAPQNSDEAEHFLKRLISDGRQVEATSPAIDINKRPDYFDSVRFKRAQKVDSILIPLLRTGKSQTVVHLYDRYTATVKFVRQYYESDFYELETEGRKAITLVRSMHQRIHKIMNRVPDRSEETDTGNDDLSGELWVNQHDMALTQFAFIGLFLLYPRRCAAYNVRADEVSDIAYYWRLISYYLGIEERFNIFVHCDDLDKQLSLMQSLLEHLQKLRSQTLSRDVTGQRMAEGFMLAFEDLSTESSFNILEHWWWPSFSLSGRNELKPYTLGDRWKLIFFYFYFEILFRSETLMSIINNMYKKKFDKFCADGEKVKSKLAKKYKDIVYESQR